MATADTTANEAATLRQCTALYSINTQNINEQWMGNPYVSKRTCGLNGFHFSNYNWDRFYLCSPNGVISDTQILLDLIVHFSQPRVNELLL